jgi:hypothetical protein
MARVPLGKSTVVDLGPIAGLQHSNCGWRCDKPGMILRSHGGAVASVVLLLGWRIVPAIAGTAVVNESF